MPVLAGAIVVSAVLLVVFLVLAGLIGIICWAFGLTFAWKYVVGVWAIIIMYRWMTRGRK